MLKSPVMRQAVGCGLPCRKAVQSSAVRAVTQASRSSPVHPVPGAASASRHPGVWRDSHVNVSPYSSVTRNGAHIWSCVQYAAALSSHALTAEVPVIDPSPPPSVGCGASPFTVASPESSPPPTPPSPDVPESLPPLAQAGANAARRTSEEKASTRIRT